MATERTHRRRGRRLGVGRYQTAVEFVVAHVRTPELRASDLQRLRTRQLQLTPVPSFGCEVPPSGGASHHRTARLYLPCVSAPSLENVVCNLCGSSDARVIQPAAYDIASLTETDLSRTFSSSSDQPLHHRLVACSRCGLQYVSPRLRADAVLEGYAAGTDEQFVSQ